MGSPQTPGSGAARSRRKDSSPASLDGTVLLENQAGRNIQIVVLVRTMSLRPSRPDNLTGRLAEHCGLVGGAQLLTGTRCVGAGVRDAEVEFAQFINHRLDELGASVAEQFGANT